ncbi:MAG: hypothetical protein H6741_06185 [Alphaproteobacteria bacterium]|nr:hypothetical protein [Alphaproteobacteria bacterium]MCB9792298.1 hypothetical protein [Alphaproteobacteria bacterium]
MDTISWAVAMRREFERAQRQYAQRAEARQEATQERSRERAQRGDTAADLPLEVLACPRCLQRFDFGYDCPHCGEALVGASAARAAGQVTRHAWALDLAAAGLCALAFVFGLGFVIQMPFWLVPFVERAVADPSTVTAQGLARAFACLAMGAGVFLPFAFARLRARRYARGLPDGHGQELLRP